MPTSAAGYREVGRALAQERFGIVTLSTLPREGVPAQCTVVVLAGPSKDLLLAKPTR